MRYLIFVFCLLIFFYSCSTKSNNKFKTIKCDIEQEGIWNFNSNLFSDSDSYSGKYSSMVDSTTPNSFGIQQKLSNITKTHAERIVFSAYCKLKQDIKGVFLICGLKNDSTIIIQKSIEIDKFNKWSQVKGELIVPLNLPKETKFYLFLHSSNGTKAYIDDIRISIY